MNWFFSVVRIAGFSFPVASSLVQLQSEIDSKALSDRVSKLEDPISNLHEDIPSLSSKIYKKLISENESQIEFEAEFYKKYSRPLAIIESYGFIKAQHTLGHRYYGGIVIDDPSYIMYLCALNEDDSKMEKLISTVEKCGPGEWLDGELLEKNIELPLPVIKAVFTIYESKGYGNCSNEIGIAKYMGVA